jgi:hypothetical protein
MSTATAGARPLRRLHREPNLTMGHPAGAPVRPGRCRSDQDRFASWSATATASSPATSTPSSPAKASRSSRRRCERRMRTRTAERFVRTVRTECLDSLLIVNRSHLERVLRVFAGHYNSHRPHRALNLKAPNRQAQKLTSCFADEPRRAPISAPGDSSTNTDSPRETDFAYPHGNQRRRAASAHVQAARRCADRRSSYRDQREVKPERQHQQRPEEMRRTHLA